jgi:hypothetical protein
MNRAQNACYHRLRKRRDALLANPLPESDTKLLTYDATRSLLAATNGNNVEVALYDAEFIIRRVEEGREQIAEMVQEALLAGASG